MLRYLASQFLLIFFHLLPPLVFDESVLVFNTRVDINDESDEDVHDSEEADDYVGDEPGDDVGVVVGALEGVHGDHELPVVVDHEAEEGQEGRPQVIEVAVHVGQFDVVFNGVKVHDGLVADPASEQLAGDLSEQHVDRVQQQAQAHQRPHQVLHGQLEHLHLRQLPQKHPHSQHPAQNYHVQNLQKRLLVVID